MARSIKTARQIAASRKNIKIAQIASARKRKGTGKSRPRGKRRISAKNKRRIRTAGAFATYAAVSYGTYKASSTKTALRRRGMGQQLGKVQAVSNAFTAGQLSLMAYTTATAGKGKRKAVAKRFAPSAAGTIGLHYALSPGEFPHNIRSASRGVRNVGAYGRGFKQGFSQSRARQKRAAWNGMQYAQGTTVSRDFGPRVSSQLALPRGYGAGYNRRHRPK